MVGPCKVLSAVTGPADGDRYISWNILSLCWPETMDSAQNSSHIFYPLIRSISSLMISRC
jgi:hypothetical protein